MYGKTFEWENLQDVSVNSESFPGLLIGSTSQQAEIFCFTLTMKVFLLKSVAVYGKHIAHVLFQWYFW